MPDPAALTIVKAEPLTIAKSEPDAPAENSKSTPSTNTGLATVLSAHLVPFVQSAIDHLATSPTVVKTGAAIGRGIGAVTSFPSSVTGLGAIQRGMNAGSKAGALVTTLAQDAAAPASKALGSVTPYIAGALNTAGAAQGALDLAQMAEPNRKDIGVLGMGIGPERTQAEKDADPALLNDVAKKTWNALTAHMHPAIVTELLANIQNAIAGAVSKTQTIPPPSQK